MIYTVFDQQGRPIRSIELPDGVPEHNEWVRMNVDDGETAVNGDFTVGHYLNLGGLPTPIPKPPSPYHTWDWPR